MSDDTDDIGQRGIALVRPLLLSWCETASDCIDTNLFASSADYQRFAGDFLIRGKQSGKWFGVEVKTEREWTGNFYAETYSNAVPGPHERLSWLVTGHFDRLVNVFLDIRAAVVIPFRPLRKWLVEDGNLSNPAFTMRMPHREQRNRALGQLVPFERLALPVVMAFYLCDAQGAWAVCRLADVVGRAQRRRAA